VAPVIALPAEALVLLVGPAGAGKSTFAGRWFRTTEVVSSDACRALVADSGTDFRATDGAFRVLQAIVTERLRLGRLAVVDATNVQALSRRPLVGLAGRFGRPAVAIVFALSVEDCLDRNRRRQAGRVPARAVHRQHQDLRLSPVEADGFDQVHVLASPAEVDAAVVSLSGPRPAGRG